jgi:hypothetical protein
MRKLILSLLAAGMFALPAQTAESGDDINWIGDYQQALKLARESGKPIFLEYRCEP